MIETKMTCDRCKATANTVSGWITIRRDAVPAPVHLHYANQHGLQNAAAIFGHPSSGPHLCPECASALSGWLTAA